MILLVRPSAHAQQYDAPLGAMHSRAKRYDQAFTILQLGHDVVNRSHTHITVRT